MFKAALAVHDDDEEEDDEEDDDDEEEDDDADVVEEEPATLASTRTSELRRRTCVWSRRERTASVRIATWPVLYPLLQRKGHSSQGIRHR